MQLFSPILYGVCWTVEKYHLQFNGHLITYHIDGIAAAMFMSSFD